MPLDLVALLVAYHAAIDRLDFAAIEAMFAEDAVYLSGGLGGVVAGRADIMAGFRDYFETYPDQVSEDSLVERLDGSRARACWSLRAHDARTRAVLARAGEEVVTFDETGRIVRVEVTDGRSEA